MTDRPGILWLVLDCARYDRISAHGYPRQTTPNLDKLIASGLDYHHAYSVGIWSLPAYTSLLTGLYPRRHGVNVSGQRLDDETLTLPAHLQKAGYATACFSNNAWLSPAFGLDDGFQRFDCLWWSAQESVVDKFEFLAERLVGRLTGEGGKGARRTNRRIVSWLKDHRSQPTFTFVSYIEPHTPYTFHRQLESLWERGRSTGGWRSFDPHQWVEHLPDVYRISPGVLEDLNLRYDLEMHYLDSVVGELLTDLARDRLLQNTIVIVTADHGELLGEHHKFGHLYSVAEPLRHVPLIVWAPHIWRESAQIEDVVQTIDLPATICHWCGEAWHSDQDVYRLPERNGDGVRQYAITDYPEPFIERVYEKYPHKDASEFSSINLGLTCVSDDRYKVVYASDGSWCGYDLKTDPAESQPISVDSRPPFGPLRTRLETYLAEAGPTHSVQDEIPQEVVDRLRALGYFE